MCLAAASASASSPARCRLSPSSAALPRSFLRGLLGASAAAPARPSPSPTTTTTLLRRCLPFQRMAQYWTQASLDKNKALVDYLKQYGAVRTDKVAEVMETIDRGLFVPEGTPYIDSPMPIGFNATISAPHMHATCLELLKDHLQPGMHALDVGSGSGYLTACFAMMVGPEGRAVGIEHIPEIVASALENVQKSAAAPLLNDGSLSFHVADGRLGFPDAAPYDAIHVGAAAPEIPQPLLDQLKPGGRMVIPVGTYYQDLQVVDKNADGSISVRNDASVRYVPLTSRSAQCQDP
ncbi:unnamed protein product [Urochloa humidicola]